MANRLPTDTTKVYSSAWDGGVTFNVYFESDEQRDEFVARFPKYVKVSASALTKWNAEDNSESRIPNATVSVTLAATTTNGGVNEAGLKRIRKFLEIATQTHELEERFPFGNSVALAAHGIEV